MCRSLAHNHSPCQWLFSVPGATWHCQDLQGRRRSWPLFSFEPGIRQACCSSVNFRWFPEVSSFFLMMGNSSWASTSQENYPVTSQQVISVFPQVKHMGLKDFIISQSLLLQIACLSPKLIFVSSVSTWINKNINTFPERKLIPISL